MRRACVTCLFEVLPDEDSCPRCGGDKFYTFGDLQAMAPGADDMSASIDKRLSRTVRVVKTQFPCWVCDYPVRHYMVMPIDKYGHSLTTLPQCPIRVFDHSHINIEKGKMIEILKISNQKGR